MYFVETAEQLGSDDWQISDVKVTYTSTIAQQTDNCHAGQ